MTWMFVIAAVLFAIALALALGASVRGNEKVKGARPVQIEDAAKLDPDG